MPQGNRSLLEIDDVTIRFHTERGDIEAVSHASLSVERGHTVAIVGESGSGKTTLTSALNRLLPANGRVVSGSIVFDGKDILAVSER